MRPTKALAKLRQVFEVARTDESFREHLARDPRKALAKSNLDLTRLEILTIVDIVGGEEWKAEKGLERSLSELRQEWASIQAKK